MSEPLSAFLATLADQGTAVALVLGDRSSLLDPLLLKARQTRAAVTLDVELLCGLRKGFLMALADRPPTCGAQIEQLTKSSRPHPIFSWMRLIDHALDLREQLIRDAFRRAKRVDELLRQILHARGIQEILHLDMPELIRGRVAVLPGELRGALTEMRPGATDEGPFAEMRRQGEAARRDDVGERRLSRSARADDADEPAIERYWRGLEPGRVGDGSSLDKPTEAELGELRRLNEELRRVLHYINGAQTLWLDQ